MTKQVWRYRVRELDGTIREDHMRAETVEEVMAELRIQEADVVSVENVAHDDDRRDNDRDDHRRKHPPRLEPEGGRPPPTPREVPKGADKVAGALIMLLIGGLFVFIASIFIIVGIGMMLAGNSEGVFFTLFPLIHFSVGAGLLTYVLRSKRKRRAVIASGRVAMARVTDAGINQNTKINGRSPYRIRYEFDVNGNVHTGKRSSMASHIQSFDVDDRMWVLYDPDDPSRNVEWPPL